MVRSRPPLALFQIVTEQDSPVSDKQGTEKMDALLTVSTVLFREDQLASPLPVGYAALISCSCPSCNRMHRESCTSRIARCEVRYDRKKVLLVNICYSLGHQRAPFSRSSAVLEVIELPEHVAR
jgi:hypothetical protein